MVPRVLPSLVRNYNDVFISLTQEEDSTLLHTQFGMQFEIQPYIENLIRVQVADGTIITLPSGYAYAFDNVDHISWTLCEHQENPQQPNTLCVAQGVVLAMDQHGTSIHNWRACVSTGGVISVLSNNEPCRPKPALNSNVFLQLNKAVR